jgi:V/A-type H+-transporting ATPase subunit G/H
MKEIVQKIMETEREVRERIEGAREEAQKIIRKAEFESRDVEEQGRQKAVREAQELVSRMKREAEEERNRQIEEVRGGSPELLETKAGEITTAVDRVKKLILGIE